MTTKAYRGSMSLGDYPLPTVRLACGRCGRSGQYRKAGLLERFDGDKPMPDVLVALANCERRGDCSDPCGVHFPDLSALNSAKQP